MIAAIGVLTLDDQQLNSAVKRVLDMLARHQTSRGHIPSLAHDPDDLGASDTTPLFLIAVAAYRAKTAEPDRYRDAVEKAMRWMEYQSPDDLIMVSQEPTSDWRDEQWVLGYGLYVNTLVYTHLRLHGDHQKADELKKLMHRFNVRASGKQRHIHEGLAVRKKPYYAMWSYKVYNSERFDLLGNSLAILSGLASRSRAEDLVGWIEAECEALRQRGQLRHELPPCLFPYIQPDDPDWRPRYAEFNQPGTYHNGGIWPFVCGFYVAALVAVKRFRLAKQKLTHLTELIRPAREQDVAFGFNEWFHAVSGQPSGQDWQTWSAAMFVYACACVEQETTPFFEEIRNHEWSP